MIDDIRLNTLPVEDGVNTFDSTVIEAKEPTCTILFAAGLGGNPLRHRSLLQYLVTQGCTVVAPHFEPLGSPVPTMADLATRARRLELAVNEFSRRDLPIAGIGHSLGTVLLIVLAGAEARTLAGDPLTFRSKRAFDRLALFAPPTDFFRMPGALASVHVPIGIWVGSKDTVTPPTQAEFLKVALGSQAQTEVRVIEDAGHFTFMDELPPYVTDPHPDRYAFLSSFAKDVCGFIVA